MPLSDDQKAMLRLLAQREQGYDDLAALMGLSVEEVRAKVKDALEQLEEEGAAAPQLPPEPVPAEEPAAPEPAAEPVAPVPPVAPIEPVEPAQPEAPAAAKPDPPRATPVTRTSPPRPRPMLPKSGGARAALAAGVAALALVIVVLAIGGGEDSGNDNAASGETTGAAETTASATTNPKLTQAVLSPVDGGDAQGLATFGRVKNSLALQIEAEGLEPTGKGQSYTVWLYESPEKMLPLATTAVGESGKIGAQVQVPTEVLAYLAKGTFDQIDVSLTEDAALKASLTKATKAKEAPAYTGTDVLRGRISGPIIGAADKAGE
jgi:hypothetical protein